MRPERHRFHEKPAEKRSDTGWVLQVAVVLLVAAAFLAWQSPLYWAQKPVLSAPPAKARAA